MMGRLFKVALALLLPFALASCVLAPGKFVSTLRIDADHHFTFSYVGEVYALDMSDSMKGLGDTPGEHATPASFQASESEDPAKKKAAADARNREIAAALSKEAGYRKVTYVGDGKFQIDYAVSGTLDHAFVFPYNLDAEAVFPFVVVELRANGTVRVKAPGFAADDNSKSVPGAGQQTSKLDGVFTLDTDAEIVSQNNEEGATPGTTGRRTISWKATPLTKDAPTAVLRLK
ncbi:MAG: hypothetical protein V4475_17915 [Pseudomonadota bacterium]|jgi:hypothetical protein